MAITGGHATGAVAIENIRAGATLAETRISPAISTDLSSLSMNGSLAFTGTAGADGRLKMTGDLRLLTLCYATTIYTGDRSITARPALPWRATLTTVPGDGFLDVKISSQAIPVTIGFDVSPLFNVGAGLLFAAVKCPFAAPVLAPAGLLLSLGGAYDATIGIPLNLSLTPDPVIVRVADVVAEREDHSAINFSTRKTVTAVAFIARPSP
jgi:hypothetical protein